MPGADEAHSVLSLPKGGGAVKGLGETFAADLHTGTGSFTVPITVPPGRNGFQPELAIEYSAGHGNGPFGMGWNLAVPAITRKTAKGIPRYRDDNVALAERDTFILSGAEDLVFVGRETDETGIAVDRYRPRTEGLFAEIFRYRDTAKGEDYWRVRTKEGLVNFYGSHPASASDPAVTSRPDRAVDIFEWCPTLTLDPFENRIEYRYEADAGEGRGHRWNRPDLAQILYVDYGDRANPKFLVVITFQYEDRVDAFSDYRAGFEIRTSRRCRSVLVATHADRVRSVRRYEFSYRQDALTALSLLAGIDVVGFDDDGTESRPLPPLQFDYTDFDPQARNRRDFYPLQGAELPTAALTDASLELVDLFGSGLPDFLEMSGTSVRYWRNRGTGHFALPRAMIDAPPELIAAGGAQLIDANGDGRTDLLVTHNEVNGYYPLQFGGLWDRRSFQPYASAPSFNLEDPEVHIVDLTGDGIADAVRSSTRLDCFFNDPHDGWRAHNTNWAERGPLEDFPNVEFSDPRVKWADFNGDEMQDIALVYDGNVEYWPNCGYGEWGHRLHMKHSPRFPLHYDPKRILAGDVNGDGLADIVYVEDRKVRLWINQSGNSWSDPVEIIGTPPVSDLDSVRLVDLLGNGVAGILWTKDARTATEDHYFFLDLTGGTKPLLLAKMDNNLGAVTKITYAPSTRFYLEDERRAASRWRTPLPFPVQVVAQVEVIDEISAGKLTSEYRYHGGYWDGIEREFRGFSCVEQFDSESFETYVESQDGRVVSLNEQQYFSPPTLTKTWFHQGPIGDDATSLQEVERSQGYWPGDLQQLGHVAGVNRLLAELRQQYVGLTSREKRKIERDALRSLRGNVLRTEVFGLDSTAQQDQPYTVVEHAYGFREESAPTGASAQHRVFFAMPLARRTTQWERGNDPMTSLAYSRDFDAFGNALTAIRVACPRRWRTLNDPVRDASYLATITNTQMASPTNGATYIRDREARVVTYEILNPPVTAAADPGRTVAEVLALAQDVTNLRVVSESIYFYDADPTLHNKGEFVGLPFGVLDLYGAVTRSESLVLTDEIVDSTYAAACPPYLKPGQQFLANRDYPAAFVQQLAPLAGYVYHAPGGPYAGGYYATDARKRFDFHGSDTVRGLVLASRDALGAQTTLEYDHTYALLPVTITDVVNLSVRASYNYRVLQPDEITDGNGNRSSVSFSPAGFVTGVYTRGKAGQNQGDLVHPSVVFDYDLLSKPACVRTIRSERHDSDPANEGRRLESREYWDGFGRLIQARVQGEHVRFGDSVFGGGDSILPARQSGGRGGTVQGTASDGAHGSHWVVSGWTVYNNKGEPVEIFEPFFSTGGAFARPRDSDDPTKRDYGAKVKIFYDPRGRVVRRVNPDGSERRTVYGIPSSLEDPTNPDHVIPTPWEQFVYDANDNAGRTHPAASTDYRHHWNTPVSSVSDALGRTVVTTVRTRDAPTAETASLAAIDEYHTRASYDIQSNLVQFTDSLNRVAFAYTYDLARRPLRLTSIDAGIRTSVFDAMGNEIERRHSQGARTLRSCDALRRPDRVWARNDVNQSVTLRQQFFYGDDGDANQAQHTRDQARAGDLLGRVVRQLDEAGELSFTYDFKANVITKTRRLIADAELVAALDAPAGLPARAFTVDWDHPPTLAGSYETSFAYDALNRKTSVQYPQDVGGSRKTLVPRYNNAGALERISLDGDSFVERIAYNAKGQRVLIAYGNGLMTRYAYDANTLRLARVRTEPYVPGPLAYAPQGTPLQDFAYDYDLQGNMLRIVEQTPGCGVRNNAQAWTHPKLQAELAAGDALVRDFEYDPLYRLTRATGREAAAERDGFNWGGPGTPTPQAARDATRLYRETYSYDAADNLLAVRHGTWTRHFGISDTSPQAWEHEWPTHLDPTIAWARATNNRVTHIGARTSASQTHFFDASGNLVKEHTNRHFAWDATGRMVAFSNRTAGGKATLEALYLYDSAGQRAKKLVRKSQNVEVTVYIDGLFEHRSAGGNENNTLQVMDDRARIALVRVGGALRGDTGPPVQYHLSDHVESAIVVIGGADSNACTFTNREEYFPFGQTSFGSFGRKRYRFSGKERDEESGLYYFGARYYMTYGCRWISTDPITNLGTRPNPYASFRNNPLTYTDGDGQFSVSNHYAYTKSAAFDLGYDKTTADYIAHFASVYADHPKPTIMSGNNFTKIGDDSNMSYRGYLDYSPTAQSQDTKSPVFSSWHAMAADNEKISEAAATKRGQEFGWSKIISAGQAWNGLRQPTRVWKEGQGYAVEQLTLGDIVRSHQSVLGDLGQGIHALQDAIRHKGVEYAQHDLSADVSPPAGEDKAAIAAAYNGLLVFELVSGDPKHLELLNTTPIDVSTASDKQFETIKKAAQAVLDNAKPNPDLVITLKRGEKNIVELRQRPKATDRPDAGTKAKSQSSRGR